MDFATEQRNLIAAANKAFGEGKWNYTVVSQTLDYVETLADRCCVGCVSFVQVQLDDGSSHQDIGYHSAEESTKGLSFHNARIGSAVHALKRVLLSFGDKFSKELEKKDQVQFVLIPEKVNNIQKTNVLQKNTLQLKTKLSQSPDKQIQIKDIPVQISGPVSRPVIHLLHENSEPTATVADTLVLSARNNGTTDVKHQPAFVKPQTSKLIVNSPLTASGQKQVLLLVTNNKTEIKTEIKTEPKSKQELSVEEVQRLERKRKQHEKQMEFKKRMMEKEKDKQVTTSSDNISIDNKPMSNNDSKSKEIKS